MLHLRHHQELPAPFDLALRQDSHVAYEQEKELISQMCRTAYQDIHKLKRLLIASCSIIPPATITMIVDEECPEFERDPLGHDIEFTYYEQFYVVHDA